MNNTQKPSRRTPPRAEYPSLRLPHLIHTEENKQSFEDSSNKLCLFYKKLLTLKVAKKLLAYRQLTEKTIRSFEGKDDIHIVLVSSI